MSFTVLRLLADTIRITCSNKVIKVGCVLSFVLRLATECVFVRNNLWLIIIIVIIIIIIIIIIIVFSL